MSCPTPFFAAFKSLLFGKPRLSEIEKLLRDQALPHSLSQYEEAFGEFIPSALLAPEPNTRTRHYPAVVTFWAFLAQVLERGSACRDAVLRVAAWAKMQSPKAAPASTKTGAYCTARARLLDTTLEKIGTHLANRLLGGVTEAELWCGRHVKIVDGTTASMQDTAPSQAVWPQPRSQKPGCGFPLVKLAGLVSLPSGALLKLAEGNRRQHEVTLARMLWHSLERKDVLLADRGFCSYADLHAITLQGADAVVRLHQARPADFRKGRRLGPNDRLVTWTKPPKGPKGMTAEEFAALPATLTLRMVRYRVSASGFRTEEVILVTTLLDPAAFPVEALAELYFQRWGVELHFREIKTLLGMDVLRCLTPAMVRKEIAMHRIAYNLVRLLMQQAAHIHHVSLARISFKGALDSLHHFADAIHALEGRPRRQEEMLEELLRTIASDLLPARPGRSEPRARKRRAKNYHLLTSPRRQMHVPAHRNRPAKQSKDPLN